MTLILSDQQAGSPGLVSAGVSLISYKCELLTDMKLMIRLSLVQLRVKLMIQQ